MTPIPTHLARYDWYAPHLAWLRSQGHEVAHDPGDAVAVRAGLSRAILSGADLCGADLRGAILSGADLPPAPVVPNIDAAILAAIGDGGELDMAWWHTCETTHCRAGWAIHLAGEAGAELEKAMGPAAAGALIYAASGSHPVPDWYCDNETAMADLRKRAGVTDV